MQVLRMDENAKGGGGDSERERGADTCDLKQKYNVSDKRGNDT